MTALPLAIASAGVITGVGGDAGSTCAAIRGAIDNFQQTAFADRHGEWLKGSEVALGQPWRGEVKLVKLAAAAITECLRRQAGVDAGATPLLICAPEHRRHGRLIGDDSEFFSAVQNELGLRFHPQSRVIAGGHVGIAFALKQARELFQAHGVRQVVIASADSMLAASTLRYYERHQRLLTSTNSNGFIPGEAGAALLVEPAVTMRKDRLYCVGLGAAVERVTVDSEAPFRADGMCEAVKASLREAAIGMGDLDFRICDLAGEHYHFKEAALLLLRLLRRRKQEFDIWHPADCVGEVGAPIGLIMIAILKAANEKGYSKGRTMLAHLGNDDGRRAAMVLTWSGVGGGDGQ